MSLDRFAGRFAKAAVLIAGGCSGGEQGLVPNSGSASRGSLGDVDTDADGGDDGDAVKFDIGNNDSAIGTCPAGGGNAGEAEFSHLWVANSPEGTVSKIDTFTGAEVGRYYTGPTHQAEPSRTSVNLFGDVVVANRGAEVSGRGGVTKIAAQVEDCIDLDGNGTIDTSNGVAPLDWGEDECVLWNLEIPSLSYGYGPRPLAWEGPVGEDGCAVPNPRVWVAWYDAISGAARIHRLGGGTGLIQDTVDVPWNGLEFGPYGGAVNKQGDFWVLGWQRGPLVRIDGQTLEVERLEIPPPPAPNMLWSYGMALDQYGNPWIASSGAAAVFDVAQRRWEFVTTTAGSLRGAAVDNRNRAWFAVDVMSTSTLSGCGIAVVDVISRQLLAKEYVEGCVTPVGVSVDAEGFAWLVDQRANTAFKINPYDFQVELGVGGLVAPYTYSDMSGAGLSLVANPPTG